MPSTLVTGAIFKQNGIVISRGTVRLYFPNQSRCSSGCNGSYLAFHIVNGVAVSVRAVDGYFSTPVTLPLTVDAPFVAVQFVSENEATERSVCRCDNGTKNLTNGTTYDVGTMVTILDGSYQVSNSFLTTSLASCNSQLAGAISSAASCNQSVTELMQINDDLNSQITALEQMNLCLTNTVEMLQARLAQDQILIANLMAQTEKLGLLLEEG
jgi:hypothetical protein